MTRPALIDVPAMAAHLGTTVPHVRRMVYERRIPFIKVGRSVRFDPVKIAAWLEAHSTDPQR